MNAPSKVATRRQREIARTRADILEAALRAFGRRGFAATTMHDIASEADYSAASLYSYFDSKDAISEAIVARLTDELLAVFDQPLASGLDFRAKVEVLVERHLAHATERCDAFAAIQEGARRSPCAVGSIYDQHLTRATAWIEAQSTLAERGGVSAEDAACALVGILTGFFRRWMLRGRDEGLAAQAAVITRFFLEGLGHGPASTTHLAPRSSRRGETQGSPR